MTLTLAVVVGSARRLKAGAAFSLVEEYLERASAYGECRFESFADEAALLRLVERRAGRVPATLVIFDGGGAMLTSEEFAARLAGFRDTGRQSVVMGIGPASGWSEAARARAEATISLGKMTLPHALAQVVVAEQIYRALTILAGHPYHCGH